MSFEYSSNFHCYKLIEAYREQLDFIRKEGELLVVEVILEIDINWSQCLRHITLLVSADQLQRKAITCTEDRLELLHLKFPTETLCLTTVHKNVLVDI